MMLEILNRVMPLEVPHVQRNNEKLVRHYMAHNPSRKIFKFRQTGVAFFLCIVLNQYNLSQWSN